VLSRLGSGRSIGPERDALVAVLCKSGDRRRGEGSRGKHQTTHREPPGGDCIRSDGSLAQRTGRHYGERMPRTGLEQSHVVGTVKLLSHSLAGWYADAQTWTQPRPYADALFRRPL